MPKQKKIEKRTTKKKRYELTWVNSLIVQL